MHEIFFLIALIKPLIWINFYDKPKFEKPSVKINFDEIDRKSYGINSKQKKKGGWSTGQKVFLAAFIIGVTALVIVLIKYGKVLKCDDIACDPFFDENCFCEN